MKKKYSFLGFIAGFPVGVIVGAMISLLTLRIIGSNSDYDGLYIVYLPLAFGIIGAIVGFVSVGTIAKITGGIFAIFGVMTLVTYASFLKSSAGVRNIDDDQFTVKGELNILEKTRINVRYKISDAERPLYTIFSRTKNYHPDEPDKNNIHAKEYEFFINYDNRLFTTFTRGDLHNCQNDSPFNLLDKNDPQNTSQCWDKDLLRLTQDVGDVYIGCSNINNDSCIKLMPLDDVSQIPNEYTHWGSIGLKEVHDNRNKRSFMHFMFNDKQSMWYFLNHL